MGTDPEAKTREPGLTGQIREGHTLIDAPPDQLERLFTLLCCHMALQPAAMQVRGKMQYMQYQGRRLVNGIVRAMSEMEIRLIESAGAPADEVADGCE